MGGMFYFQVRSYDLTRFKGVTQTTATGGGNISSDGGATITVKGVCWNTSANPDIANSRTANGGGAGTFTSSMTGLVSGTVYHVKAYATNSEGIAFGSYVLFTTNSSGNAILIIENQAYINSLTGIWYGVNIPRSKPINFMRNS